LGPNKEKNTKILNWLASLSKELGYTQTQLALAWALANKDVSTLILGFSKVKYVDENLKALELYKKWDKTIEDKVEAILGGGPTPSMNARTFMPNKSRRQISI